ncbi:MFS-type transporter SLC18B1-like [Glandiceps talaboti]
MEGRVRRSSTRISFSSYDVIENPGLSPQGGSLESSASVITKSIPDEESTKKHTYTKREYLILLSMCLANLSDFLMYSVLAPFFPTEAQHKGASTFEVGLIFGVYAFVVFVCSPLFGKLIPIIGAKTVFLTGSLVGGSTCVIFGFLNRVPSGTMFVALCFVVRIFEAIGAAASSVGAYSIIAKTFRHNIATAFGTIEIFCGLGLMIGPPVGGALYQAGGYTLPFIVWGVFTILIVIVNFFLVPNDRGPSQRPGSIIQLLKIPPVIMTSICVLVGFMGISFLDPTLADHLSQFDLSTTQIGLMFLINSGTYAISAFLWGWLTDKYNIPKLLMLIGNLASIAGYLYVGPSPLLYMESSLPVTAVALVMLGLSLAASVLPTFNEMISAAGLYGMEESIGTYSIVSGLFSGLFSLGNFLGPTLGSMLVGKIGFDWTSTIFAGMCSVVSILLVLFCMWEYRCGGQRRIPSQIHGTPHSIQNGNVEDDERRPLLS